MSESTSFPNLHTLKIVQFSMISSVQGQLSTIGDLESLDCQGIRSQLDANFHQQAVVGHV